MMILQEYLESEFETEILKEDVAAGRPKIARLRGIFQEADSPNGNKRVYPLRTLSREVERLQEHIQRRRMIGELDHPAGRDKPETKNASHVITKLEIKGTKVYGELEVIPGTDGGRNLMGLIESKIGVGISSRGTGGLRPLSNGLFEVDESFCLNTFDIVHEPSVAAAYLSEALQANQRWARKDKSLLYYLEKAMDY